MIKKLYVHLLLSSLVFFTTACFHSQKKLLINEEKKFEPLETLKQEEVQEDPEPGFLEENYVVEDQYTRVFTKCFATGKTTLTKSCQEDINSFLKETPLKHKRKIIIEVHTDKAGSKKKNLEISKKRALHVASSLYHKEYAHSQVYYGGFGEEKLLYDLESPQANRINRRLVIKLREKGTSVDEKYFRVYKKKTKKQQFAKKKVVVQKKSTKKQKKNKPITKRKSSSLLKYTGTPDVGWIYFGKESLAEKFYISCAEDRPQKVRRSVISRAKKDAFVPGLYSKRIEGTFKENYLEVYPVYVFENGALPKANPMITLYHSNKKIERLQTTVNTYRGQKGILYRIFVNKKRAGLMCMDLVIPYETGDVSYGAVYVKEGKSVKEYKFHAE